MFEELKYHVVSAPILEFYESSTNTWVELHTDARVKALGAVILQKKYTVAKHFHPIAYYSKKFNNM